MPRVNRPAEHPHLSAAFRTRALDLLQIEDAADGEAALKELRLAFRSYPDDWFSLDRRETPSKKPVEELLKMTRRLQKGLIGLSSITVSEMKERGFDRKLRKRTGQSKEAFFQEQQLLLDLNFPNTLRQLFSLEAALSVWIEKYGARRNQARPTVKAQKLLYERIFRIFLEFNEYGFGGRSCDLLPAEYINKMAEFSDYVLKIANFPHPSLGKSLDGRVYNGAFGKMAFAYYQANNPEKLRK